MPLQGMPAYDDLKLDREVRLAEDGPDPEATDRVMLIRSRISRIFWKNHFFDYPIRMNLRLIRGMGWLTTFASGLSYIYSSFFPRKEDSLENFYINRFGRKLYSLFFEGYTEKLWGRHPRDISADWGAQRVKGLSVAAVIRNILQKFLPWSSPKKVETSLIEEFLYPKYGPGQLWETMAAEFEKMGGRIVFGCRASEFHRSSSGITEVVADHDGSRETYPCDCVISSMPLKDLVAGMRDVPPAMKEIAAGLPYRDFVTVGLLLDKLKLKNETPRKTLADIIPDCWIYIQDSGVKLGRIQIFNNWSPYMVSEPESRIWIGLEYFCCENDSFWRLSDEELRNVGVDELVKIGILDRDVPVLDFHVEKVRKAYPAYFDTYARCGELIRYLDSIDNLYCVGRNGQHRYNNMDHSMATSFVAVRHILSGGDKREIWHVNTEREYHEAGKAQ